MTFKKKKKGCSKTKNFKCTQLKKYILSPKKITQKCMGLKMMNWYLRTVTPAAELKSWLRWHLPPILRVLPHKQIKQLSLFLSPLHFTPMTLHLHLSFDSLPSHTSPLTASRLSFICKYLWGKEGEEMLSSFWKTNSLTILQASLFSIWLDMAFRETQACCRQSWVGADRDSERTLVADGKREQLTPQGWNFAGKGRRRRRCGAK